MSFAPMPVSIIPHPYLQGRYTHSVAQRDAVARGWFTFGPLPLGAWRSRLSALRAAQRLEASGIVVVRRAK